MPVGSCHSFATINFFFACARLVGCVNITHK